jgi:hypothetical protein
VVHDTETVALSLSFNDFIATIPSLHRLNPLFLDISRKG